MPPPPVGDFAARFQAAVDGVAEVPPSPPEAVPPPEDGVVVEEMLTPALAELALALASLVKQPFAEIRRAVRDNQTTPTHRRTFLGTRLCTHLHLSIYQNCLLYCTCLSFLVFLW